MKTLVIYDISDDDVRFRISEVCKNFGLCRIQKSAFLGDLPSSRRKELVIALERELGNNKGNIQIFVICRADLSLRVVVGEPTVEEVEEGGIFIV